MRGGLFLNQQGILSRTGVPLNLWGDIEAAYEFDGTVFGTGPGEVYRDETLNHHFTANGGSIQQITGIIDDARGVTSSTNGFLRTDGFDFTTPTDMTIMGFIRPSTTANYGSFFQLRKTTSSTDHYFRLLKIC